MGQTFWLLASAMPTLTAFTQSLSSLQVALKDCTYALLGESDTDIKRLFQASSESANRKDNTPETRADVFDQLKKIYLKYEQGINSHKAARSSDEEK